MTIFPKQKHFFISQNPLDKLRYSLVFTKSHVFLWVDNFRGLTAGFARLPILLRTFITGYICLTKNTRFFTQGGTYPYFLYPTNIFFISYFSYFSFWMLSHFTKPTIEHQTQCRSLPCTHTHVMRCLVHKCNAMSLLVSHAT